MSLPTILEQIVAQRRLRYDVGKNKAKAFIEGKDKTETKAFIEGKGEDWTGLSEIGRHSPFVEALEKRRGGAVIAEVKLGSPKLGSIAGRVEPERMARLYAEGGAAALSVVVEPDFFGGSYELLRRCREASALPVVAKDFLVSERQLDEAASAGADAVLLIAALCSVGELSEWGAAARARGLVPLVETHDAEEIARVVAAEGPGREWELVGINNRDLRTFEVDLERSIALRSHLPADALAVAESGIESRSDVRKLATAGFDAFLIGESLLLADDPAAKLAELIG
jgi:indole-3-glycerol phosphate synthase